MNQFYNHPDVDDLYRDSLKYHTVKPPANAWDNIEQALGEKVYPGKSGIIATMGVLAVIVLILVSLSIKQGDQLRASKGLTANNQDAPFTHAYHEIAGLFALNHLRANVEHTKASVNKDFPGKQIANVSRNHVSTVASLKSSRPTLISNRKPDNKRLIASLNIESIASQTEISLAKPIRKPEYAKSSMTFIKGFQIGIVGNFNNTWILQNKTPENTSQNLFVRSLPSPYDAKPDYRAKFGTSWGLHAAYQFSLHSSIDAEILLNAKEGQKYAYLTPTGRVNKTANLEYMRIPLMYRYRMSSPYSFSRKIPATVSYLVGLQYARLNQIDIDPNIQFLNPHDFNTNEWGLVLGMEYDFYLSHHYSLTLGSRASISRSVQSFPFFMSQESPAPNNAYLGLTARFNYNFGQ